MKNIFTLLSLTALAYLLANCSAAQAPKPAGTPATFAELIPLAQEFVN